MNSVKKRTILKARPPGWSKKKYTYKSKNTDDDALSEIVKERDLKTKKLKRVTHRVRKNGKIIHQDIKYEEDCT